MAIRILHVVDTMGVGGLQNGLVNLINQLDGYEYEHVVCGVRQLGTMADRLPSDRVRTVCLESGKRRSPTQVVALSRLISQTRPDVVHSRNWGAIEAVAATKVASRCAVIHSEHGFNATAEPRRRNLIRRIMFETADRVITVSHHLKGVLLAMTGLSAEKLGVIHNGVDTRRFYADPAARIRYRRELGIAEAEFCLGTVGRLDPVKDHLTLFRAAEQLAAVGVPYRLLVVGDGPERLRLQEYVASQPGLQGRVRFLGDSQQIPDLLRALDVYVLSSTFEGISNSLLEAMASGLPVVVSRAGGNPEVVAEGECGLVFPIGNSDALAGHLRRLYERRELREYLAQKAQRQIEQEFSLQAMATSYGELYHSVVRRTKPAAARRPGELTRVGPGHFER